VHTITLKASYFLPPEPDLLRPVVPKEEEELLRLLARCRPAGLDGDCGGFESVEELDAWATRRPVCITEKFVSVEPRQLMNQ
jgi:hypothetical protein